MNRYVLCFPFLHYLLSIKVQMSSSNEAIMNMLMDWLIPDLHLKMLASLKNELLLTTPRDVKEKGLFSFLRAGHGCLKAFPY